LYARARNKVNKLTDGRGPAISLGSMWEPVGALQARYDGWGYPAEPKWQLQARNDGWGNFC